MRLPLPAQGCTLDGLHLTRLYTVEDKYSFLRSEVALRQRIMENSHDIFDANRGASVQLYRDVVGPLFDSVSPLLKPLMWRHHAASASHLHVRDLFLWATLIGNKVAHGRIILHDHQLHHYHHHHHTTTTTPPPHHHTTATIKITTLPQITPPRTEVLLDWL